MIKHEELVQTSEYWFENIQNEIFRQVAAYLKDSNLNQTQFAEQLGVSKGYVSQVMKGEFNYTLKKLIELSLAVGKAPVIEFRPLAEISLECKEDASFPINTSFINVAEPGDTYLINASKDEK